MESYFYKVIVHIKERSKPLGGIKCFPTMDKDKVYNEVKGSILKYYYESEILKIDIWPVPEKSDEVQDYLREKLRKYYRDSKV